MITCRKLSTGYGRSLILHGVSLSVLPGRLYGLLGPNGSGKSTLLRSMARLLVPRGGQVFLEGRDLYDSFGEREAARQVALVPQEDSFAYPVTVRELIQLGRTPYLGRFGWMRREDLSASERSLEEMDLGKEAERQVQELSGGERKRAVIAQALAQEARVLLLDEPTSHLDVAHAMDLFALLRKLAAGGRTVLVASHEIWQLARYCDRLLLLERGSLRMEGTPARVLASKACGKVFSVKIALKRERGRLIPIITRRDQ